jgi:hypothetical protein
MNPNDYDKFYEVYTTLQMTAANGGIASLDADEVNALVQGVEDLHRHAERLVEVYDHYSDIQEVGGEPLREVIENLAHVIDRTGGESR